MVPMTKRQAALLEYVKTIYPQLGKAKSVDDGVAIVLSCVRADSTFIVKGLAQGALKMGQHMLEQKLEEKGAQAIGKLGEMAGKALSNLWKK